MKNLVVKRFVLLVNYLGLLVLCATSTIAAQDSEFPPAPIANDEGGAVSITGQVTYTNPFFTIGVAQPLIVLEDQAGFIDHNRSFVSSYDSQALGFIDSDFYVSPFTYTLHLPAEP